MRKVGYIALSLYLLLVGLSALIANFIVPNALMAILALIASFGIFLEVCIPAKKNEYRTSFTLPSKNFNNHSSQ
jgi:hypothetical protein